MVNLKYVCSCCQERFPAQSDFCVVCGGRLDRIEDEQQTGTPPEVKESQRFVVKVSLHLRGGYLPHEVSAIVRRSLELYCPEVLELTEEK